MNAPATIDPILDATKRNSRCLGSIFLVMAMAILYVMASQDAIFTPVLVWGFGVVPVTILQVRRPFYPFCTGDMGPMRTLTVAQGRALTYLKQSLAPAIGLWVGCGMSVLILFVVLTGHLLPVEYVVITNYAAWPWYKQAAISLMVGLAGAFCQGLAIAFTILSETAGVLLRRWQGIQSKYTPWPLGGLRREFFCLAKGDYLRNVRYTDHFVMPDDITIQPLNWRGKVAILCHLVGGPGLVGSVVNVGNLLLYPATCSYCVKGGTNPFVLPAIFLGIMCLGQYLWKHRS